MALSVQSAQVCQPLKCEINAEVDSLLNVKWQGQHVDVVFANAAKTSAAETKTHLLLGSKKGAPTQQHTRTLTKRHTRPVHTVFPFRSDPQFMLRGIVDH